MQSPVATVTDSVIPRETRPPHLSEIELAAYVDRALDPAERERTEAHLDACADCRQAVVEVWRMSQTIDAPVAGTNRGDATLSRRNRARRVIASAAVLLAASITIVLLQRPESSGRTPALRSVDGTAGSPTVFSVSPTDGAEVDRNELVLRWTAHPPGLFRVTLLDSTGSPVMMEETTDSVFVVPSSVRLQPGATYFWRVDVLADGITASSPANRLILAR